MDFKTYHSTLQHGERRRLADTLGVAPTYLCSMAKGRRPFALRHWQALVELSGGLVSFEELVAEAEAYRRKFEEEKAA